MDRRLYRNQFFTDRDDREATPESGPDSPLSGDDIRMRTAPSHKKGKKGVHKRVVTVPIGDIDGSKSKGEVYPPSDSWAWRKYGQKPIKGSPYPRGYYRCSSSKGCPARKQVERSRMDPTKLIITYACEHNHSLPTTKHHHHHHHNHHSSSTIGTKKNPNSSPPSNSPPKQEQEEQQQQCQEQQNQQEESPIIFELSDDSLLSTEFGWFHHEMGTTNVFESPICTTACISRNNNHEDNNREMAMAFSMKEEDESLFADLEELPEYSMVFRQSGIETEKQNRNGLSALPCCGTTG